MFEVEIKVVQPLESSLKCNSIYLHFIIIITQLQRQKAHATNCSVKCKFFVGNISPGRK